MCTKLLLPCLRIEYYMQNHCHITIKVKQLQVRDDCSNVFIDVQLLVYAQKKSNFISLWFVLKDQCWMTRSEQRNYRKNIVFRYCLYLLYNSEIVTWYWLLDSLNSSTSLYHLRNMATTTWLVKSRKSIWFLATINWFTCQLS